MNTKRVVFKEGEKVNVVVMNELKEGVLDSVVSYGYNAIAIVKFNDGSKLKVKVTDLIKVSEPTPGEEPKQEKVEFVEKDSVTITSDEFKRVASNVVTDLMSKSYDPALIHVIGAKFCSMLHVRLFVDN